MYSFFVLLFLGSLSFTAVTSMLYISLPKKEFNFKIESNLLENLDFINAAIELDEEIKGVSLYDIIKKDLIVETNNDDNKLKDVVEFVMKYNDNIKHYELVPVISRSKLYE